MTAIDLQLKQFAADESRAAGAIQVYSAFASDLGFPPGKWPAMIRVPGLGNGRPFVVDRMRRDGSVEYYQEFGTTHLVIYND